MFGYIRPVKEELLVRELAKYRAVYCGICKQIKVDYGQVPRLAAGYDITLLAVLLLSLAEEQPELKSEACIMNPLHRRPVIYGGGIFQLCAALSVLLASYKAEDDIRDESSPRGKMFLALTGRARSKARRNYREYDLLISSAMTELNLQEQSEPDPGAAGIFAQLMRKIFRSASKMATEDDAVREAVSLMGEDLGSWIYLLDAIDDLPADSDNKRWNPFSLMGMDSAREYAGKRLVLLEESIDRTAALLPYRRDSGLIANIITMGLPEVRTQVLAGKKLPRV